MIKQIFTGWSSWEMIFGSQQRYEKQLLYIKETLQRLPKHTKIVWLNQYPLIEKYAENGQHSTKIYSEKMLRYNLAARRIFK